MPVGKTEGSGFDDVVADGVVDQFGQGMEIEFQHDVGAMSLGGFDGDTEEGGDFLVGFAFGEKLKDFAFSGGEARARGAGGICGGVIEGGGAGDARGEVRFVLASGVDRSQENAVSVVFEDVGASAGVHDLLNEVVGFVHGEDKNFGFRGGSMDAASGFDAVEERHADIEDGDIRFDASGFFGGVAAIGGFGANLPAGAGFEKRAQAGANDGVIIGDEDAKRRHEEFAVLRTKLKAKGLRVQEWSGSGWRSELGAERFGLGVRLRQKGRWQGL